jgi:flagellar biosynthesis protein FlhA
MEMEVGLGLVRFVDPARGAGLLEQVGRIRRQMAVDLGLVVPAVRIRDDRRLPANQYVIRLRGARLAGGTIQPDRWLAMDTGQAQGALEGIAAREPAFGLPSFWIADDQRSRARDLGYTVVDAATVLTTHLTEVVKQHAHELLTREEVNALIRNLRETSPAVVDEVVPSVLKPGEVQKVLQNLLREGVPIRDLGTILEALGDYGPRTKDPELLTEYARNALARTITQKHVGPDGRMVVVTLDPKVEDLVKAATAPGGLPALPPSVVAKIGERIGRETDRMSSAGHAPVVLCSPSVRAAVKRIADAVHPGVSVLSYNEIVKDVRVESLGLIAI